MSNYQILTGDVRDQLRTLPDDSVHCVVTSPPYWGLRDYGTASWEGGDAGCDHKVGRFEYDTPVSEKQRSNDGSAGHQARDDCPKCGATRIDSQLGLEPTPEQYVSNMVEVFREVRRVLRADGTLWLNLGDSYANTGLADSSKVGGFTGARIRNKISGLSPNDSAQDSRPRKIPVGLKPKDLVGIPWRVARALQEPYYTGRIKSEADRIWLAAMLDAEGCMFIHRRKKGQHNGQGYYRKNDSFGPGLEIANISEAVVERCLAIVGQGSICSQSPEQNKRRKQTIYRYNLRTTQSRELVRELYPYLVAKQHEARLLYGCPSSGSKAKTAWEGLKALHRGEDVTVDFPEPPTLFEQGWWLRSDVIWAKPSPMPESVRDRPTKAHEYLFLLTKSKTYYYDADAIMEPSSPNTTLQGDTTNCPSRNNTDVRMRPLSGNMAPGKAIRVDPAAGRNKRSVWTITTQPYPDAHFAVFPEALVVPCVKAGTSEHGVCECGTPWQRVVERSKTYDGKAEPTHKSAGKHVDMTDGTGRNDGDFLALSRGPQVASRTVGWEPGCTCEADRKPATVLDPFCGSGTVGVVCSKLGRDFVGIELNPEYVEMAKNRIHNAPLSLFAL